MNKKGNVFLGISVFLLIYIFGVLFMPYITDNITQTRGMIQCSNSSITDGTKLVCLETDIIIPYFILFIISAAGGYLLGSNS